MLSCLFSSFFLNLKTDNFDCNIFIKKERHLGFWKNKDVINRLDLIAVNNIL